MERGSTHTAQPNHYTSRESQVDKLTERVDLFIDMIEPADLIGDAATRQDFKTILSGIHEEIAACGSDFHRRILDEHLTKEVAKKFDGAVSAVVGGEIEIKDEHRAAFLAAINDAPVDANTLYPFLDKWHEKAFQAQQMALRQPELQQEADRLTEVTFHYAANDKKVQQHNLDKLQEQVKDTSSKSDTFALANSIAMKTYGKRLNNPKSVSTQVTKIVRHTLTGATIVTALVAGTANAARADVNKETTEVVPNAPSTNKEIKSNDTKITLPAANSKPEMEKSVTQPQVNDTTVKNTESLPDFTAAPAPKEENQQTAKAPAAPPKPDKAPTVDQAPAKDSAKTDSKDNANKSDATLPAVELPEVETTPSTEKAESKNADAQVETNKDSKGTPQLNEQPTKSPHDSDETKAHEGVHVEVPEVSLPDMRDKKDHDAKPVGNKDHSSDTEPSITPVIDLPEIDKDNEDKEKKDDTPVAIGGVAVVTLPDPVEIEKSEDKSDHKDKSDEFNFIVPPSAHVPPEPTIIEIPTHKQDTPRQEQGPSTPQGDYTHAADKLAAKGGVWERVSIAMNFFMNDTQLAMTPSQAAGLIGNLMGETYGDMNPGQHQGGGPAFGIAQWEGGRLMDLGAFAGKNQADFKTQLEFIKYELLGKERYAFDMIKTAKNREEAAVLVRKYYERPSAHRDDERKAYANQVGDAFNAEYQAILASRIPKQETNTNGILAGWPTTGEAAMKLFNQCDPRWGEIRTPNGVRACDVSCGPTSVAMAVNALTGKDLNPGDVIRMTNDKRMWLPGDQGTSFDAVINLGKSFGINGTQMQNFKDINAYREILKNGGMILVAGSGPAPFVAPSVGAHFVLIRGITEDGKFLVADPYPKTPDTNTGAWNAQPILDGTFGAVVFTK